IQRTLQTAGGFLPDFVTSYGFFRFCCEKRLNLLEAEQMPQMISKVEQPIDFAFELIETAEQMCIIHGKATYSHQAMQHAGTFKTIDGSKLCQPQGQIAIATKRRTVNRDVDRTVHGLELILVVFQFHRCKHVFAEITQVPARSPVTEARHMRSISNLVPALIKFVVKEFFEGSPHTSTLRKPDDQTCSHFIPYGKQSQPFTQFSMVAFAGFFKTG